ncbi:MAG: hypothetical protein WED33_00900 [Bacteroidia bacterium]
MRKLSFLFILFWPLIILGQTTNTVHGILQYNFGIASPLERWDKDFDAFSTFFTDVQTLSSSPGLRLYGKPAYIMEFNYIRNISKPYTWKIGSHYSGTSIEKTSGTSYAPDSVNIGLTNWGLQAYLIRTLQPAKNHTILFELGIDAGLLSLSNNELISTSDTVDFLGLLSVVQNSNLQMETTNKWLVQGVFKLEWLTEINENWIVSAGADFRLPLTTNTRFTGVSTIENDFFPVTTNFSTPDFSMKYWSFNLGISRSIYTAKKTKVSN